MSEKKIIKKYTNGEITIAWKPDVCAHATHCWKNLPQVFSPRSKPWVNIEGASSEQIMEQVKQCPSGALSYVKNEADRPEEKAAVEVKIIPGGPAVLIGEVCVVHKDGSKEVRPKTSICRCGLSSNKPFCDGSHRDSGFEDA